MRNGRGVWSLAGAQGVDAVSGIKGAAAPGGGFVCFLFLYD